MAHDRIEQAIARRKMIIEGREFHEVYGYTSDGIIENSVDTDILADECVRLFEWKNRLIERCSKEYYDETQDASESLCKMMEVIEERCNAI